VDFALLLASRQRSTNNVKILRSQVSVLVCYGDDFISPKDLRAKILFGKRLNRKQSSKQANRRSLLLFEMHTWMNESEQVTNGRVWMDEVYIAVWYSPVDDRVTVGKGFLAKLRSHP